MYYTKINISLIRTNMERKMSTYDNKGGWIDRKRIEVKTI